MMAWLVVALISGAVAWWIAEARGLRSPGRFYAIGFLIPIAGIVAALLMEPPRLRHPGG